jgi:hypothetical protein
MPFAHMLPSQQLAVMRESTARGCVTVPHVATKPVVGAA